jgi:hypothetical protein
MRLSISVRILWLWAERVRRSLILLVPRTSRLLFETLPALPALALSDARLKFNAGGRKAPPAYFFGEPAAAGAVVELTGDEGS